MRRHGAGTGHRLLTWPTDRLTPCRGSEEVLGLMTKQVFQLKDPVPTSKPDVPAAREHPVFAPGHAAPGRTSPTGTTRCPAPPRCAKAQGRHTGQTRAKAKGQAEELDQRGSRCPVSRIRHRHPGAAALQVPHGRGPLQVDMGRRGGQAPVPRHRGPPGVQNSRQVGPGNPQRQEAGAHHRTLARPNRS